MDSEAVTRISDFARRMRRNILEMARVAGASSSHFGGGLSLVEITATLYAEIMRYDVKNPNWKDRDRFILSKGHGVLGYYTALAEAGFIDQSELMTFEKSGSDLLGHPIMKRDKAIEFSNGSLGMGLSLGIGVALAAKKRACDYKVYVVMGDGECNEGSVWEAAQAACHFKLDNLTAIIDRNNLQQTGSGRDIMNLGDMAAKWKSFGWNVHDIDGHNIESLLQALRDSSQKEIPKMIVAHTVKGKGFSFSENNNDWHHAPLSSEMYDLALSELNKSFSG